HPARAAGVGSASVLGRSAASRPPSRGHRRPQPAARYWKFRSQIGYGRFWPVPPGLDVARTGPLPVPVDKATSRHRADAPVTTALPRPLRRAIGAGGLAVVLAGSLAFAANQPGADSENADATDSFAASEEDAQTYLAGRTELWDQASRSGQDGRDPAGLLDEAGPAVHFQATVDGETYDIESNAETVADALIENGIVVGLEDNVAGELNSR